MVLFRKRKKKAKMEADIQANLKAVNDVRQLICESKCSNPEVIRQLFLRTNEIHERILYTVKENL